MKNETTLHSVEETENFAAAMGARLKGGECIELVSDLGGGKTTFTSGLVAGSGSLDSVSSPTFTISKQYHSKKFTFYHFDFYRLTDPGIVAEELYEAIVDKRNIVIVEWAESVAHVLPKDRIRIVISKLPDNPNFRNFSISVSGTYKYVLGDQK
jgi:tRNA threonylcarbamoyladenosine biosynthesis protein TsaE